MCKVADRETGDNDQYRAAAITWPGSLPKRSPSSRLDRDLSGAGVQVFRMPPILSRARSEDHPCPKTRKRRCLGSLFRDRRRQTRSNGWDAGGQRIPIGLCLIDSERGRPKSRCRQTPASRSTSRKTRIKRPQSLRFVGCPFPLPTPLSSARSRSRPSWDAVPSARCALARPKSSTLTVPSAAP